VVIVSSTLHACTYFLHTSIHTTSVLSACHSTTLTTAGLSIPIRSPKKNQAPRYNRAVLLRRPEPSIKISVESLTSLTRRLIIQCFLCFRVQRDRRLSCDARAEAQDRAEYSNATGFNTKVRSCALMQPCQGQSSKSQEVSTGVELISTVIAGSQARTEVKKGKLLQGLRC